jgi:hypothetical protein
MLNTVLADALRRPPRRLGTPLVYPSPFNTSELSALSEPRPQPTYLVAPPLVDAMLIRQPSTHPGVPEGIAVPGNATVQKFVPHGIVLDRAVCAITHGGMGSAQKVLARGVPVCVVPHGRDQFEVARRVKVARCGTRLPTKKVNPRTIEVEGARGYVDDRRCKASCRRLQDHWRCEPWRRRDRATITRPISLKDQPRCLQSPAGNSVPAEPLPVGHAE